VVFKRALLTGGEDFLIRYFIVWFVREGEIAAAQR
jgi:hypothetical protein